MENAEGERVIQVATEKSVPKRQFRSVVEILTEKPDLAGRNFVERLRNKWKGLSDEERIYYSNIGILFAMQALDVATTLTLLGHGVGQEANPIVRALLESGPAVFLAIKLSYPASSHGLLMEAQRRGNPPSRIITTIRAGNILMAAVVINNALLIKRFML